MNSLLPVTLVCALFVITCAICLADGYKMKDDKMIIVKDCNCPHPEVIVKKIPVAVTKIKKIPIPVHHHHVVIKKKPKKKKPKKKKPKPKKKKSKKNKKLVKEVKKYYKKKIKGLLKEMKEVKKQLKKAEAEPEPTVHEPMEMPPMHYPSWM